MGFTAPYETIAGTRFAQTGWSGTGGGVTLPPISVGMAVRGLVSGAGPASLWASFGGSINGQSSNLALTIQLDKPLTATSSDQTHWSVQVGT